MAVRRPVSRRRPFDRRLAVVVWVYAGGGHSELGLIPWLQRHFRGVKFERRMPQKTKPGPRPGVSPHEVVGNSGKALDKLIKDNLAEYWQKNNADVLLLLDDTDCEAPAKRRESLQRAVKDAIAPDDLPCVAIALAVPELEVWLLADWQNAFAKNYGGFQVKMRDKLKKEGVDFTNLESFDCRCKKEEGEEYRKISETLKEAFDTCSGTSTRYSKGTDTSRLLMQVDPAVVAQNCPHFKTFWNKLNSCIDG